MPPAKRCSVEAHSNPDEATEEAPMSPGTFPLHGQHGNAKAI
jgi:hypothetical protein